MIWIGQQLCIKPTEYKKWEVENTKKIKCNKKEGVYKYQTTGSLPLIELGCKLSSELPSITKEGNIITSYIYSNKKSKSTF